MEKEDNTKRAPWWQPALVLFMKLSGWIAGPVLLGVIVGKWLDRKYNTEPWLFLVTVGVAFFLSMFGIIRDSIREIKRIEKEEKNKSKIQSSNDKSNPKS
jgi:F0F1-type ATP synthase assembly protein I